MGTNDCVFDRRVVTMQPTLNVVLLATRGSRQQRSRARETGRSVQWAVLRTTGATALLHSLHNRTEQFAAGRRVEILAVPHRRQDQMIALDLRFF